MQLPSAIESVLNQHGVTYSLIETEDCGAKAGSPQYPRDGRVARASVLQDQNGRVQAVIPSDCLLDLAALNSFTGRNLSAATEDATAAMASRRGLLALPALPQILNMPMVVDQRVLESEDVVLEAGVNDALVHIKREDFRRILESTGSAVGNFSVPLDEIDHNAMDLEGDIADITNAVSKFTTFRIKQRLEETLDFPPLPEIAHRIIQIGADPYASVKDLAQIVEIDPSLSAQVVSWASSPYYAAPGKIKSIHDAIVRVLGFDLVMNLALGLALGKTLRLPKDGRYGYRNYWIQAVHCAAMVEGLVKAMPPEKRPAAGLAYLAGLLHNCGFLIMAELFKPQLQLVCRYTEANPHVGHPAVERFLLGVTREQMAALLMRFWHLPEEVCTALRHQNDPDYDGEHAEFARLLYVAVRTLRLQGIGTAPVERVPDEVFAQLGLSRATVHEVGERIHSSSEDFTSIARELAA